MYMVNPWILFWAVYDITLARNKMRWIMAIPLPDARQWSDEALDVLCWWRPSRHCMRLHRANRTRLSPRRHPRNQQPLVVRLRLCRMLRSAGPPAWPTSVVPAAASPNNRPNVSARLWTMIPPSPWACLMPAGRALLSATTSAPTATGRWPNAPSAERRRGGDTAQQPSRPARTQDADAVAAGLLATDPARAAPAAPENAAMLGTDVVGVAADHPAGSGEARSGVHTTMAVPGAHRRVNPMAAISTEGTVRFRT